MYVPEIINVNLNLSSFDPMFASLNQLKLTRIAEKVFGRIHSLSKISKNGRVWIVRSYFANFINCAKESISRAIGELVKKGLIRKTGEYYLGIFPYVEMIPQTSESVSASCGLPETSTSLVSDMHVIAQKRPHHTKQRKQINLKRQQEKTVCSKILEKNHLKESLKNFGIGANKAMRIMADFPRERIENQIINLETEQARGVAIENPAGWLIKAIQKNFRPAIERVQKPVPSPHDEIQAERSRTAQKLLQEAIHAERIGQMEESKQRAQKSLELHRTNEAQEHIKRIDAAVEKKAQQEKALAAIPKEEFKRMLAEEIDKQKTILMRIGITKIGELHEKAAYAAMLERF